jgi:PBSX family phage terminase large subunit
MRIRFVGYPKQVEFMTAKERVVVFQAGAGSGKTRAGSFWALSKALSQPGSRGMIVASSHPQMNQSLIPYLEDLGRRTKIERQWKWNLHENVIRFRNGSVIFLRSADKPSSLLGADLAWAWGDEVALWKRNAWRYFVGRVRQPGYVQQIAVTMTPKGKNWTYKALGTSTASRRIIHATTEDNVYVGQAYKDSLKEEYGEGTLFYAQEAGGEYVTYEGLIYSVFGPQNLITEPEATPVFEAVVGGIDWGWTNPAVILLIGIDSNDRMYVFHETYVTHKTPEELAKLAFKLQVKHRVGVFYADPSEPGNIATMVKEGVNCKPASNEVIPGIASVNGAFANKKLYVVEKECPNLLAEIDEYKWKSGTDGEPKADSPTDEFNHALDGLRYGYYTYRSSPDSFMQVL